MSLFIYGSMSDNYPINPTEDINTEKHWNDTYFKNPIEGLGWYEENPMNSLELIEMCDLPHDALIFNAGVGTSTLIGKLLSLGYTNLVVNDIASSALKELKENLSEYKHSSIKFIVDDLTNPKQLLSLKNVDIWHDRAVLHFFTKVEERKVYFDLIRRSVRPGGFVILAEFNLMGAKKCSGLDIVNYDEFMLSKELGTEFELLKSFDFDFHTPAGALRTYIYTLYQRKQNQLLNPS